MSVGAGTVEVRSESRRQETPMPETIDLGPAAQAMAELLAGVRDDQLASPTPCSEYTLGDLIDHIGGLSTGFALAAAKDPAVAESHGDGDASRLGADWRPRIAGELTRLADAWRKPEAWEGMTRIAGLQLPGEIAGRVALNELVVHGWDVARASGQPFTTDDATLQPCLEFVQMAAAQSGGKGPFGPPVPVPEDAPRIDRLIGLAGRDPAWPDA